VSKLKCYDISVTNNVTFLKRLMANQIYQMLATIQIRIFCLPVSYQKTYMLKYTDILCGCETSSLTLREECNRLRVLENRMVKGNIWTQEE
jgi:hypothetical protein